MRLPGVAARGDGAPIHTYPPRATPTHPPRRARRLAATAAAPRPRHRWRACAGAGRRPGRPLGLSAGRGARPWRVRRPKRRLGPPRAVGVPPGGGRPGLHKRGGSCGPRAAAGPVAGAGGAVARPSRVRGDGWAGTRRRLGVNSASAYGRARHPPAGTLRARRTSPHPNASAPVAVCGPPLPPQTPSWSRTRQLACFSAVFLDQLARRGTAAGAATGPCDPPPRGRARPPPPPPLRQQQRGGAPRAGAAGRPPPPPLSPPTRGAPRARQPAGTVAGWTRMGPAPRRGAPRARAAGPHPPPPLPAACSDIDRWSLEWRGR